MKAVFLFALFLISWCSASADGIWNNILLPDGRVVTSGHTLLDGENPTLQCPDEISEGYWVFSVLSDYDYNNNFYPIHGIPVYTDVLLSDGPTSTFTIDMEAIDWSVAYPEGSPLLFEGKVRLYKDKPYGECVSATTLYFKLLPEAPVIGDMSFDIAFDWDNDGFKKPTPLTLSVNIPERATSLKCLCSDTRTYVCSVFPNEKEYKIEDVIAAQNKIVLDDIDWGEYIQLYSSNQYGSVVNDVIICTTDLIENSNVLNRIDELYPDACFNAIDHIWTEPQHNAEAGGSSNQYLTSDHIFTANEDLYFYDVFNVVGFDGLLSFSIAVDEDEYVVATESTTDRFSEPYHIEPLKLNWLDAFQFVEDGSNIVYTKGKVQLFKDGVLLAENILKFNILPEIPQLGDVVFDYDYNWETDKIAPNGTLEISVETERTKRIELRWTNGRLFDCPDNGFKYYKDFEIDNSQKTHKITCSKAEWGMYFMVTAINDYGTVDSQEIICTTDLISDPDIIARIEYLKENGLNGVDDAERHLPPSICIDGEYLVIKGDEAVHDVKVFTPMGALALSGSEYGRIDIGRLHPGVYIVSYKSGHNSIISKFVKQ